MVASHIPKIITILVLLAVLVGSMLTLQINNDIAIKPLIESYKNLKEKVLELLDEAEVIKKYNKTTYQEITYSP